MYQMKHVISLERERSLYEELHKRTGHTWIFSTP